jgi:DNA polymerase elongation subunit (family B)
MYKKCYVGNKYRKGLPNVWEMHVWESDGEHKMVPYENKAYVEDNESYTCRGLNGEKLKPTSKWYYNRNRPENNTPNLHFHDMKPHQKYLIETYGTDDKPSTGHQELFYDIECEIGGALTEEYIERAPMPITSIAFWHKQSDSWGCLILDPKGQVPKDTESHKKVIPFKTESELLLYWVEIIQKVQPDILIGYNSDYFDNPYTYFRICNVCGKDIADQMSPLYGKVREPVKSKKYSQWFFKQGMAVDVVGIESLDYMRLHKKYSFKDEPSWKLDSIGEKYANINKIEYDGNLNDLYTDDINKFVEYNFRDVEILQKLDEKLQYIALTKNLAHKGKHNYSEVYSNSVTQDGAISAYLLDQGIIPNNKEIHPRKKEGYAGGYLFCPKAGLYKYMFDEDLTSLYPSIIMTINIGRETYVGRIIDVDDRNNRLGLNDLKEMDPKSKVLFESSKNMQDYWEVGKIIKAIEKGKYAVSANGSFFSTQRTSTLSAILSKWFDERVLYKNRMKKAYKSGNTELGEYNHLMQYTMKILLNSLYGATALPNFRYGMNEAILSEAITLSGHRIIQESALAANRHMNKVIKGKINLEI